MHKVVLRDLQIVPQIEHKNSVERFLNKVFEHWVINNSGQSHFLIIVNGEVDLPHWRNREQEFWVWLSLLEPVCSDFVDLLIFLSMTNGSLLKLTSLNRDNGVVVTSLKNLDQYNHLLILHEVEGAHTELEGVT